MNKLIYTAILAIFLFSSCKKSLDLQPLSQISPDKSFASENELHLYVLSFYDSMLPTADGEDSESVPDNSFTSLYTENADNISLTEAAIRLLADVPFQYLAVDGNGKI